MEQLRVAVSVEDKSEFIKFLKTQAKDQEEVNCLSFKIIGEPVAKARGTGQLIDILLSTEGILAVAVPVLALWLGKGKQVTVKFGKDRLVLKNMREQAAVEMLKEWLASRRNAARKTQ